MWVRLSEATYESLKSQALSVIDLLALLGKARQSRLKDVLHHQQPTLPDAQIQRLNSHLSSAWENTIEFAANKVRQAGNADRERHDKALHAIFLMRKVMQESSAGQDIRANEKFVFISYSHKDEPWLKKLLTMLKPMVRNQTVSVWYDGNIRPSQDWRLEIDKSVIVRLCQRLARDEGVPCFRLYRQQGASISIGRSKEAWRQASLDLCESMRLQGN